ncbi:hypothetical protein STEG23_029469 [Scotinomys teguina]
MHEGYQLSAEGKTRQKMDKERQTASQPIATWHRLDRCHYDERVCGGEIRVREVECFMCCGERQTWSRVGMGNRLMHRISSLCWHRALCLGSWCCRS